MSDLLVDNYKSRHSHPLNKLCHTIGIPMITIAWPLFFFRWRWALALFTPQSNLFVGRSVVAGASGCYSHRFKQTIRFESAAQWISLEFKLSLRLIIAT
jgi:hypothetical protein